MGRRRDWGNDFMLGNRAWEKPFFKRIAYIPANFHIKNGLHMIKRVL